MKLIKSSIFFAESTYSITSVLWFDTSIALKDKLLYKALMRYSAVEFAKRTYSNLPKNTHTHTHTHTAFMYLGLLWNSDDIVPCPFLANLKHGSSSLQLKGYYSKIFLTSPLERAQLAYNQISNVRLLNSNQAS